MRALLLLTATIALAACSDRAAEAPATNGTATNDDANMAEANMADGNAADANLAAPVALSSINNTTWEYTDSRTGKRMTQSIDAAGNYITNAGKEHVDHGTAIMKGGKACFTSAMTKDGEMCWSDPRIALGTSGETVSDGGQKLTITRVTYMPLTM